MNAPDPDRQLDALFALARERRADTSDVEFGFETRLMARVRAQKETGSVLAMVSWRLVPFFATCVVALALWQSEVVREADDAQQAAYLQNPEAIDQWNNLN